MDVSRALRDAARQSPPTERVIAHTDIRFDSADLECVRVWCVALTQPYPSPLATLRSQKSACHSQPIFPLFQRLALPVRVGRTRIPGIKIQETRMIRLMEILLHAGTQLAGWRTLEIHTALLTTFGLKPEAYSLTQLRYDLRKMKAHELVERPGRRYSYRLTDKGIRVATMFVVFHKRVYGPLAQTLFQGRPDKSAALRSQSKRPTIEPMLRFKSSKL